MIRSSGTTNTKVFLKQKTLKNALFCAEFAFQILLTLAFRYFLQIDCNFNLISKREVSFKNFFIQK